MNWKETLEQAVVPASALLYVSSAHSASSTWMANELQAFLDGGRPVVPIVIDEAGASNLIEPLRSIQWVDFRKSYEVGVRDLIRVLPTLLQQDRPIQPKVEVSKGYVFLSYAEEDAGFVDSLKLFMEDHEYAYWDYRKSERDYQMLIFEEVENAIREASATLSVLSPDWKRSRWASREYVFSEEAGIPVFLLRARELEPTLAIAGVPYIDFARDQQAGLDELHRELRRRGL
jgi:ribosomal protein L20